MLIFDTSIWISYFIVEDSNHEKAVKLFASQAHVGLSEYILLEIASVLTLKLDSVTAKNIVEGILDDRKLFFLDSNNIFERTLALYLKLDYRHKLSFVDISLIALSRDHKILSFDKELNKHLDRQAN